MTMMSTIDALETIEKAADGNTRLEALRSVDSPELRKVLNWATSPQITFGIKKLPTYESRLRLKSDAVTDSMWFQVLGKLLKRLQNRQLTGNAAQDAVRDFLAGCTYHQAKWSERIIKQDLRLNIGPKEINNTLGKNTIFQFGVPLAVDYVKAEPKHLKGRWCVEPKLDGARCVAFLPAGGRVTLYSRTGKEWKNFEPIREKLQTYNDGRSGASVDLVLDGEVVSIVDDKINFQALQHNLFHGHGVETGKLKYLVFDAATRTDWEEPVMTYAERYDLARDLVSTIITETAGAFLRIGIVDMFVSTDPDRSRMLLHSREMVQRGYEGAMYRRADAGVALKRSRDLLKVKSFQDAEAEVVGAQVGTGKYEGLLGALTCKTGDGKVFEIGSGFTDEQRRQYWKAWTVSKDLPTFLTFKYQELTEDKIPRFPIFKGFRSTDDIGKEPK